jgi:Uncharacterized protein conserved in bacteria (DUF2188).
MAHGKDQHVVYRRDDNTWAVEGEGNSRATAVTSTKQDAINIARQIAQNQQSELIIHNMNGQIGQKDSHGYDPCPPKDKN